MCCVLCVGVGVGKWLWVLGGQRVDTWLVDGRVSVWMVLWDVSLVLCVVGGDLHRSRIREEHTGRRRQEEGRHVATETMEV